MSGPDSERVRLFEEHVRELDEWKVECADAVLELAQTLEIDPPGLLLDDPRIGLADLDDLVRHEDLSTLDDEERVWVEWHLIAYVGEYFIRKFGGEWVVDGDSNSPTFSRYVVSIRDPRQEREAKIDPGGEVYAFLRTPPGRNMIMFIGGLEGTVLDT